MATLNNKTIIMMKGIMNIHNGSPYAINNYTLNNGSSIIGDTLLNYGGSTLWNGENDGCLYPLGRIRAGRLPGGAHRSRGPRPRTPSVNRDAHPARPGPAARGDLCAYYCLA